MSEEETISDFNGKLCDIANESFSLGEKIPEKKLVKKVLDPCYLGLHTRQHQ